MAKVLLRSFEEGDAEAVYALHVLGLKQTGTYVDDPSVTGVLDQDLRHIPETYQTPDGEFLVATWERRVIGMGAFRRHDPRTAIIKRMRVHPEFQGQGIGGRILDTLLASIKERGYERVVLDTAAKQVAAQHLYESRGFEIYKRDIEHGQSMMYYQKEL